MATEDPALPPNPEFLKRQPKWFKPVFKGAIVASVLFLIALLLFAPALLRPRHRHRGQSEIINNARQIGFCLLEFDHDYGCYPNDLTSAKVTANYPAHGWSLTGTSSNALFRQFFAVGYTQSEAMFYARTSNSVKPDGDITPGHLLEPGECGFSYITNLSSKDDPATPIVLTPLIPGTTKFDPKPFDGKAIVLLIDCSVRTYDIQNDGHIYDKGIDLLSSKHPVWKGKKPDIRYPE